MSLLGVLKQSTAVTVAIGPFPDSTDGDTAETALTIAQADVRLKKNGGNAAQKNNATSCTHDEEGMYDCPLSTTDTNTLGILTLFVHEAGALMVRHEYLVVPANIWDSWFGADKQQVDLTEWLGSAPDALSSGKIPADLKLWLATAPLALSGQKVACQILAAGDFVQAAADKVWSSGTRTLTAFSTTLALSVWDVLESAITTASSIGLKVKNNLDAAITTRSSHSAADVWTSGTRTLTAFSTTLALSVWDVLESAITTASSIGLKVKNNLDAAVTTRTAPADSQNLNMSQALPGSPTANTTGQALKDADTQLDAAISTRATPAQVGTEARQSQPERRGADHRQRERRDTGGREFRRGCRTFRNGRFLQRHGAGLYRRHPRRNFAPNY